LKTEFWNPEPRWSHVHFGYLTPMNKFSVAAVYPVAAPNSTVRTDMPVTIYGIDLSQNNGKVDWMKVMLNSTPISFAYIKCTQDIASIDSRCAEHANGVSATGMNFGFYHSTTLNGKNPIPDAMAEARFFDAAIKAMAPCRLMPALDIKANEKNLSPAEVQLWISTFLLEMNSLGRKNILIYSNSEFLDSNLPAKHPFGNFPLWHSQYTRSSTPQLPRGWTKYTAWRFSQTGKVNGVNSNCDVSRSTSDFLILPG